MKNITIYERNSKNICIIHILHYWARIQSNGQHHKKKKSFRKRIKYIFNRLHMHLLLHFIIQIVCIISALGYCTLPLNNKYVWHTIKMLVIVIVKNVYLCCVAAFHTQRVTYFFRLTATKVENVKEWKKRRTKEIKERIMKKVSRCS